MNKIPRFLRWVLIVPLGIYELILLFIAFALVFFGKRSTLLAKKIIAHADALPSKEWYFLKG